MGEFVLDPMVVTAQRMETRDLDTPAAVSVVSKEEMESKAFTIDNVKEFTKDKEIVKVITVPKKLVNIVVK